MKERSCFFFFPFFSTYKCIYFIFFFFFCFSFYENTTILPRSFLPSHPQLLNRYTEIQTKIHIYTQCSVLAIVNNSLMTRRHLTPDRNEYLLLGLGSRSNRWGRWVAYPPSCTSWPRCRGYVIGMRGKGGFGNCLRTKTHWNLKKCTHNLYPGEGLWIKTYACIRRHRKRHRHKHSSKTSKKHIQAK